MVGIPLIAAEGAAAEVGAAEDAEGGGVEAGHNDDAEQGTETTRDEGAERTIPAEENPASDAERGAMAEHVALAAGTSPDANVANAEGAAHASVEEMGQAARGPSGGDATDEAHAVELVATLLAVSSLGREAHADAEPVETGPTSAAAAEAEA
jgi:hypothetical protein